MQPAFHGVLAKTPLEHLLGSIAERRLRGSLVLRAEGVTDLALSDVVTFVDGLPAKIRITDPVFRLGDLLVELGAIDEDMRAVAEGARARGAGLLGEILLRNGAIDASVLGRALRVQLVRKLILLFGLPASTNFALYDGVDALAFHGAPELLPVEIAPIVFAGVRAHPRPHADFVLEALAGSPLRVKRDADLRGLTMTPDERDLVGLLRMSPMSIEQFEQAGVLDGARARTLAYALLMAGQVEAVVSSPAPRTASREMRALQRISSAPVVKIALKRVPSAPVMVEEGGGDGREEVVPPSSRKQLATFAGADAFRDELRARLGASAEAPPNEILGLGSEATMPEIETAYVELAMRFHPDQLAPELVELRADCERLWARIALAHVALIDACHAAAKKPAR